MLSYHTAGDSHGERLMGILEGFPAHVPISIEAINNMLSRRQGGYGRSQRQRIEQDRATLVSGIWKGVSTGAPIGVLIENKASTLQSEVPPRTIPRPGHADLAGAMKYGWEHDINPIIERSSARETAVRTAIGAICQQLLQELMIEVVGHVKQIGHIVSETPDLRVEEIRNRIEASPFYCADRNKEADMRDLVDAIREDGDSLGGVVEVIAENVPPGLGDFKHNQSGLDAQLAQLLISIPSVKAVEIGDGIQSSCLRGSEVHDEIILDNGEIQRKTNHAGGIEGGMSNGENIIVRVYHKPIPTMVRSIHSVDLKEKKQTKAPYIRSDVVIVPAAAVVAEACVSFILVKAILEKFGHDQFDDIRESLSRYRKRLLGYSS